MNKRTVIIGEYDTAAKGWTLNVCQLADAEQKTNYIEKVGGDGSWNLSTTLTDGIPRYKDRTLMLRLECSEGTREDRRQLIAEMVNGLDGFTWPIYLPDRPGYYLNGQVRVRKEFNNLANSAVNVEAVCEPWLYKIEETVIRLTPTSEKKNTALINEGRRALVPQLDVVGDVLLEYGAASLALSTGTYEWPILFLTPGAHPISYSGEGTLVITYREAVLE